ncbi:MAG: carbohydrate binding family 9 domain-containing protein, partial [Acidobacteria bacterium]|nr:carbohydrate binding family 9 domain-containing protein [Acidobacteriota bacterium]
RTAAATRATSPIAVDGRLDEPAWQVAPIARGFIQNEPREGEPATFDTEVRIVYDEEAIYFGVVAADPEPSGIVVTDLKKDYAVDGSDAFVILLDTFHDGRNGYQFATNPAGAKWDAQLAHEGRDFNVNWDGMWAVETRITETGWVAEIVIPFRTLKFADRDPQTWGVNFRRKVRRLNEDSYWSPLPRIYGLERVSMAGTLDGLRGIRAGRNIRIKPYVSTSGSTVGRLPTRGDFDGGVDVKYGLTTGLVWDFTVNTDFSQVEADEQQVNLTRFSLFFPEKRDFFLENAGMFDFGSTGGGFFGSFGAGAIFYGSRLSRVPQMRLFFSRRIGLSEDGEPIPIVAGTRLSGRAGAYSVGALNIQQGEAAGAPAANITAIRVRRDILTNSDIGAVLLNKEDAGPAYNRMAGVDANFRFGFLTLNGVVAKSMSPERPAAGSPSRLPDRVRAPGVGNEYAARAFAQYQDRTWQFRGGFDAIGGQFENELGFVPQRGVNAHTGNIARAFRSARFPAWLREFRPHWEFELYTRQDNGSLDQRFSGYHLPLEFSNGGFAEIGVNTNAEVIEVPFTLNSARRAIVSPGRHAFTEYFALFNGNPSAPITPAIRYSFGSFYNGYKRSYAFGPSMRPNEKLNGSLNLQINDIDLPGISYVSTLATARVNYSFSTSVFLNALVQYHTDTGQLSSNVRFNVIHRPLSDFFLVYNERRDERTNLRLDRALIAKFTYMLAL